MGDDFVQSSSIGFNIINNVYVSVVNKKRDIIVKEIETHNKASRNMVTGILRFLSGAFTQTNLNETPLYEQESKLYIPCFFNVGDGGVELDSEGNQQSLQNMPRIPKLTESWNETVDYADLTLKREFFVNPDGTFSNERQRISQVTTTLLEPNTADMDSIYFYCEVQPGGINQMYGNKPVFVTELGMFAGASPGEKDLLASVKLSNFIDSETREQKTNALYVRPDDTLIIRWIITVAAIGKDSILKANVADEYGDIITSTITQIPNLGNIEIEEK